MYTDATSACQRCIERGGLCGEKLLGPKTESKALQGQSKDTILGFSTFSVQMNSSPIPETRSTTCNDTFYLKYFFEIRSLNTATLLRVQGRVIGFEIIPPERYCLLGSSQVFFCAALALASFYKAETTNNTFQYLGLCYKYLRNALSDPPGIDTVYTCYILTVLASEMTDVDAALTHLLGMYRVIKSVSSTAQSWEWPWFEGMWLNAAKAWWAISEKLRLQDSSSYAKKVRKICVVLQDSSFFRQADVNNFLPNDLYYWLIVRYQVSLDFHFMHYLLLINRTFEMTAEAATSHINAAAQNLFDTVQLITELLSQQHPQLFVHISQLEQLYLDDTYSATDPSSLSLTVFDIHTLSFYLTTKLIEEIIASREHHQNDSSAVFLARSLCRVSVIRNASAEDECWADIRDLVFAGVTLTKPRYPTGTLTALQHSLITRKCMDPNSSQSSLCVSRWLSIPNSGGGFGATFSSPPYRRSGPKQHFT